ncbi:MAG: hypothetical protein H7339_18010 [Arcicella sp.]|nr:hypothetical protein [Arcicella sp.]
MIKKIRSLNLVYIILISLWSCSSELPALKIPKSPQKDILSFKFVDFNPVVEGDIDTTLRTVRLRVPIATKVTALKPSINVSLQATVLPNSLVAQNFTSPITYFVIAADCTKRAYQVSVVVALATDPEITGIETITIKTTESFFIYGKNFIRGNVQARFILTSKTTGKTYNLSNVSITAIQAKVQVPFVVPTGLYSITVDVNGRQFKYRQLDLKVTGAGTELIINRMTVFAYVRGQDLIITGNNIKATKVQIRFQPQIAGTPLIKDGLINATGTEIKYNIEATFPAPNRWTLTVILDGKTYFLPDLVTITAK